MGNFKSLGNFEDQTGEKKRVVWLGKQPIFGHYKEEFFGPALIETDMPIYSVEDLLYHLLTKVTSFKV
jgi:hypothetical protein